MRTHVDTMLSPESAMVEMARNCADWPDAVATAAAPPSSAVIRFSKTSYETKRASERRVSKNDTRGRTTVGLPMRE